MGRARSMLEPVAAQPALARPCQCPTALVDEDSCARCGRLLASEIRKATPVLEDLVLVPLRRRGIR